jgi:nucleoside-diphosphate-sugar epimerase
MRHVPCDVRSVSRLVPPGSNNGDRVILVSGATGFVGRAVVQRLLADDESRRLVVAVRRGGLQWPEQVKPIVTGDLNPSADWSIALEGVTVVIHSAGRVHVMHDTEADPLTVFRAVNVGGTLNLARQAVAAGVRRFVFVSSVKVNGELTQPGLAFTEADAPGPQDAYGKSKHEAEQGLLQLAADTGMEVVIIRSPLVYGPGVKANFAALMRAVQRGWPLPLGAVNNQRSLVALDNLVDFIVTCITHPQAANQTFLVSDGRDLSTAELVRGMAHAAGVSSRLLPVPMWALQAAASMLGRGAAVQRLCGNLQVDISKACSLLGWVPPVSVEEGLRRAMGDGLPRVVCHDLRNDL